MKKNKTLAYTLAAALLVGGTFLGTKALFQDQVESSNPLILTSGKVDISIAEDGKWRKNVTDRHPDGVISSGDKLDDNEGVGTEFKNVQPGDTFSKYISIINNSSTYDVNLKIEENLEGIPAGLEDYIVVEDGGNPKFEEQKEYTIGSQFKNLTTLPIGTNTGGYVTIKILDKPGAWEALNNLKEPLKLDAFYKIIATQAE